MKKLKDWHYVGLVLLVIGVLYFTGGGYFLGSVTGLCSSNDPTTLEGLKTSIGEWSFNDLEATISSNDVSWDVNKIEFVDVHLTYNNTCTNYLSGLISASYQNNLTFSTEIVRDRTVVFIEPNNFYWCDQSGSILMRSTNSVLKDRFFEAFVTCLECHTNESVVETCADGTNITSKFCNETGYWTYPESCPVPVVEEQPSVNLGSAATPPSSSVTCVEGAVYDSEAGTCVPLESEPVRAKTNWFLYVGIVFVLVLLVYFVYLRKKKR